MTLHLWGWELKGWWSSEQRHWRKGRRAFLEEKIKNFVFTMLNFKPEPEKRILTTRLQQNVQLLIPQQHHQSKFRFTNLNTQLRYKVLNFSAQRDAYISKKINLPPPPNTETLSYASQYRDVKNFDNLITHKTLCNLKGKKKPKSIDWISLSYKINEKAHWVRDDLLLCVWKVPRYNGVLVHDCGNIVL